jgi:6,7-dimethyl-8-ribityllumazine synthase
VSDAGVGVLHIPDGCGAVQVGQTPDLDVAIVASRYNADVVQRLLDGAVQRLGEAGIARERITVVVVAGAWELPLICRRLAEAGGHQAVISLGCVIRGETPHFDYVCAEAARGITRAAIDSGVPVSFGVLTCDTREQALDRSGGRHGNKGAEAADAAMEMAGLLRNLPRRR